jgi:sugar/nucleoside kinase (ribokinase family)
VVDAAGAADAFTAAYLAHTCAAAPRRDGPTPAAPRTEVVREALSRACALAADVATRAGSRPG